MKLAFLIDPLHTLKPEKDSSIAMMREATRRGHEIYALEQHALAVQDHHLPNQVQGQAQRLTVRETDVDWYAVDESAGEPQWQPLSAFDAILMRKDPPFDMEYVYSTYLLELAEQQGARIFNAPRAIRDHNEKFSITQFPQFTPATLVTRNIERIHAFLHAQQDVILKPLDGMGGSRIFRVRPNDPNLNVIIETLTQEGQHTIMAQRYIPEISAGDKRILLIGGQVVPYALARIPQAGETRGNLAAGGRGVAQPLSMRDRQIAETLAPLLNARGLFLVGLDVIGDYLTEINVTSPTCFVEITAQTGFSVAGLLLDQLEQLEQLEQQRIGHAS